MKNRIPCLMLFFILILLLSLPAAAEEITLLDGYDAAGKCDYYLLEDGSACLRRYTPTDTDARTFAFPETITDRKTGETIPVSRLDDSLHVLFVHNIERLVIPDFIHAEANAFRDFSWLKEFIVSDSHPSLAAVDGVLFDKDCHVLLSYPSRKEGDEYFLPDGVTTLAERSFYQPRYLKSVIIPASVVHTEGNPFIGDEPASLTVSKDNPVLVFAEGALYDKTDRRLISFRGSYDSFTVPDGILSIDNYAFCLRANPREVSIPSTVLHIGTNAFDNCSGLEKISLSEGLRDIGTKSFYYCRKLAGISLPDSLQEIGKEAFSFSGIQSLRFPASLNTIPEEVASYCYSLADITLPTDLTRIDQLAFINCASLSEINLPGTLQSIGMMAFDNSGLKQLTFPASLEKIGSSAFSYCYSLEEVVFSGSPEKLNTSVFFKDENLRSVTLCDGLKVIDSYCFGDCTSLKELTIPSSVLKIASDAFNHINPHLTVESGSAAENLCLEYGWDYSLPQGNDDPFAWLHEPEETQTNYFSELTDPEPDTTESYATEPESGAADPEISAETSPEKPGSWISSLLNRLGGKEDDSISATEQVSLAEISEPSPEDALLGIAYTMADQIRSKAYSGTISLYTSDPEITQTAKAIADSLSRRSLLSVRCLTCEGMEMEGMDAVYSKKLASYLFNFLANRQNSMFGTVYVAATSLLRSQDVYPLPAGIDSDCAILLSYQDDICLIVSFLVGENGTLSVIAQPYRAAEYLFFEDRPDNSLEDDKTISFSDEDFPVNLQIHMKKLDSLRVIQPENVKTADAEIVAPDYIFLSGEAKKLAAAIGADASSQFYLRDLLRLPENLFPLIEPYSILKGNPDGGIYVFGENGIGESLKNIIAEQDPALSLQIDEEEIGSLLLNSLPGMLTGQLFGSEMLAAAANLTADASYLCDENYTGIYWLIYRTAEDCRICSVTFQTNSHGVLTAHATVIPGTGVMGDMIDAMVNGSLEELAATDISSTPEFLIPLLAEGRYYQ